MYGCAFDSVNVRVIQYMCEYMYEGDLVSVCECQIVNVSVNMLKC